MNKVYFSYYGAIPLEESHEFDLRETYEDLIDSPRIARHREAIIDAIGDLEEKDRALKQVIDDNTQFMERTPLLAAFLYWSKTSFIRRDWPDCAKILLENDLIPFRDKKDSLLLMKDVEKKTLTHALELIRCKTQFTISVRESLTLAFVHFFDWLAYTTRNRLWKIQDPDRWKARDRVLPYDTFMQFLEKLDQKSQLIAQLLYLGGSRTIDQVLNLQFQDICYSKQTIQFEEQTISYPLHIFQDIKMLAGKRSSGRIFLGRQSSPLNRTTVFRAFKEASLLIGIKNPLSPKDLTASS